MSGVDVAPNARAPGVSVAAPTAAAEDPGAVPGVHMLPNAARRPAQIIAEPVHRWIADQCSTMAASIAFYSAFSIAPTLVIVIAVASMFYGADAVQGRLFAEISGIVGKDAAAGIQAMVANAWQARMATGTTIVSLGAVVIGASATFSQLNTALNRIWPLPPMALTASLVGLLRIRLISFGLVLGIGFLIVVMLILDALVAGLGQWLWGANTPSYLLANLLQHLTTLVVLMLAFTAMLKLLPEAVMRWRDAWKGGLAAALLFTAGKGLFAFYLARAGTANTFGAAGSLAIVLMWLYYSAAVFLLGAEVAAAAGRRHEQRSHHPQPISPS
ncbi:MAG: YihY/virulence factor BrkB family protein [Janthinobacterium lividum]